MPKFKIKCKRCDGTGKIMTIEDAHQSAGEIPCPDCKGTGEIVR